jgi:O-antigen/teichoic acid export membrane protein
VLNTYIKSSFYQLVEKIIRLSLSFYISILLANYLGVELFGILNFSQSFVLTFAALASIGTDNIVYRDLSARLQIKSIITNAIVIRFFGFLLTFLIVVALSYLLNLSSQERLLITIFLFAYLFTSFSPVDIFLQVSARGKEKSLIATSAFLFSAGIRLYLIYTNSEIKLIVVAIVFESIFQFIMLFFYSRQRNELLVDFKLTNVSVIKDLCKRSVPILLSAFVIALYTQVDILMIKFYMGDFFVGIYSVASRLSVFVSLVPIIIMTSIFPFVIKQKEKGEKEYNLALEKLLFVIYLLGIVIAIILTFFSEMIVDSFYSSDFKGSVVPLIILSWAILFQVFGAYTSQWLVDNDLQRYRLYRVIIALIINIVLNIVWIPKYGVIGAAWATLISNFFAGFAGNMISKNTIKMFYIQIRVIFFISAKLFFRVK